MTITAIQCRCCGNDLEVEGCVIEKIENEARLREAIRKIGEKLKGAKDWETVEEIAREIAREGR